jgi:hypothetical protein
MTGGTQASKRLQTLGERRVVLHGRIYFLVWISIVVSVRLEHVRTTQNRT